VQHNGDREGELDESWLRAMAGGCSSSSGDVEGRMLGRHSVCGTGEASVSLDEVCPYVGAEG